MFAGTSAGWTGNDLIDGGSGRDVLDFSDSPRKVSVNLTRGRASGLGSDRLKSIENVFGSRFADSITGNAASNALDGSRENDVLFGRGGRHLLEALASGLRVEPSESFSEGRARVWRWKRLCGSDKFGLEAPIEGSDASAWCAPEAVRQMQ